MDGTTTTPTSYSDADAACVFRPSLCSQTHLTGWCCRSCISAAFGACMGRALSPSRQCLQAANDKARELWIV